MRIAVGLCVLVACTPSDPPGATSAPSSSAAAPVHAPTLDSGVHRSEADSGAPAPTSVANDGGPSLSAEDGALAQTEDAPKTDDPLTQARAKALFETLVSGDSKTGEVFFFPLEAYKQVKDSSNPESDWKNRLLANYARDVQEIHRARPNLQNARFVALEIPEAGSRWVKPGGEYNKIGYYRVFNSQLAYDAADGARKSLVLKSLISWRGRFYLVHLSSIK